MVYCTVCMNTNRRNKNISYFNYPKDNKRLMSWLKAVDREDLIPRFECVQKRQQLRICEEHFEPSCIKYSKSRTVKYLYEHAFPTLKLPASAGESSKNNALLSEGRQNIIIKNAEPTIEMVTVKLEPAEVEEVTEHDALAGIQVQDAFSLSDPSNEQAKELQPQKADKRKTIDLDSVTKEDFLELCYKFTNRGMSQIIKWQLDSRTIPSEYQDIAFNFFALNIHYSGRFAYEYLSRTLCLPSLPLLRNFVKPTGTETDERLLSALKLKVNKMSATEKICSVCVDFMPLKPNLFYDITHDRIIGFHEINGIQKPEPAEYIVVIMVRGIIHDWKQPMAFAFVAQRKHHNEENFWIEEIITSLQRIGLDIRAFVTDVDSSYLRTTKAGSVHKDKPYFEINERKIYYIYDVPHLMKCVLKNLAKCDFIDGKNVAKWSHLTAMYEQDYKQETKLAPKLTDIHMNPNDFQKTLATAQVLSHTVASAIYSYVDLYTIEESATDTAKFLNKINNLFDILNSSTIRTANKFKRAFSGKKYQIEFLQKMLSFFERLKLVKIDNKADVTNTIKFINGFQVSIQSIIDLSADLQSEGIQTLYTRRLNKDCVRNFFEKTRETANGRELTCRKLIIAFKKDFVCNILKTPEGTNCEKDFESSLMKQEGWDSTYDVPLLPPTKAAPASPLVVGTTDYRFDLPENNILVYVSVYLFKKCIDQHKCEKIKLAFQDDSAQTGFLMIPPVNFIAFVKLLEESFRQHFVFENQINNVGNRILAKMQHCTFDLPCKCFPIDYLRKLYIRLRIYHTIKKTNKSFQNDQYSMHLFSVGYFFD